MSQESAIDKFKEMAENPHKAEDVVNDPMFSTQNITDPMFYLDQLQIVLKDTQEVIGTEIAGKLNLPESYVEPIGVSVPLAVIVFWLYTMSRTLVKNIKTMGIISGVSILTYLYMTLAK